MKLPFVMLACCCSIVLVSFPGFWGCTPSAVNPPPDSSDAAPILIDGAIVTPCQAACVRLSTLGCPSGLAPDCVETFSHCDGSRQCAGMTGKPIQCAPVAVATSKAGVVAAGVACP